MSDAYRADRDNDTRHDVVTLSRLFELARKGENLCRSSGVSAQGRTRSEAVEDIPATRITLVCKNGNVVDSVPYGFESNVFEDNMEVSGAYIESFAQRS